VALATERLLRAGRAQEIDAVGWATELHHDARGEQVGRAVYGGYRPTPELPERLEQASTVSGRLLEGEVDVASKPGMAMMNDCFTADQEVADAVLVKQSDQLLDVLAFGARCPPVTA
jgi:hypothetical protein